jgi:hypothetical protein
MKLRQAQYQYIVATSVANPMKIGGANIDYNVWGLCEGRASRHKSSNLAQCLIVVQIFNKPLMPCFCKTLVMGSTVFNTRF